ncbi:MAG: DJ-1/PfpI family protein [Dehalococcoidia bacterium]|nr:DJ-1/PfpI family protein [Dehalococcoidia bacterium]
MTKRIGIVIFPVVEELDFVGPYEAFGMLSVIDRDWKPVLISENGGVVQCAHGLKVTADYSFDDAPPLAVILVPGGVGTRREVDNPRLIEFVRSRGQGCSYVTSVCTGAFILHRAGFLSGRRATTYWGSLDRLRALGDVRVVDDDRWVHDGNVITAAGVSAGIDMALYLVSLLKDAGAAAQVQKAMEYYPKPPQFERVSV